MRKLIATIAVLAAVGGGVATTAQARSWHYLVRNCEAPGSDSRWWTGGWYANTGNGFYGGPQFTRGTWLANGGRWFSSPLRGPFPFSVSEQIRVAENVMRSQGPGAWPWCHAHGYI